MKSTLVFTFLLLAITAYSQKNTDKRFTNIDTTIQGLLRDFHAAGCAVAVVEKNRVIYLKGFGYKDYEKRSPVTENTQFAIGSCSKAFTSTLLGMLEKDGKLDLDKPVNEYLPSLRFYNEYLTSHVTARDMMTHRTGLPRHDYSWYGATIPRDSLLYRVRYLEPSAELRTKWQYNNFMFLAQGVLAEKLYGKSWEALVKEKILLPLGMTNSNLSVNDMQKAEDYTFGYRDEKDSLIKMEFMNIDPIGPAGSINSSAKDMANWLITWVNGGKFNGNEVIPASFYAQAISPQMVIGGGVPSKEVPDVFGASYGLAWMINSYRGHYLVQHGGNIDGFSANTAFYPNDSIGIVVLVNQNASALPSMIRNIISDRLLNLPYRNWSKLQKDAIAKGRQGTATKANSDSANRKLNAGPTHSLSDYAGKYFSPGYGTISITNVTDSLKVAYNKQDKMFLKHYHYDVFRLITGSDVDSPDATKLKFDMNDKGEISSVSVSMEPAVKDIIFEKLPADFVVNSSTLERYVGEYELGGMIAKVYVRGGNTLMVLVPGQPDYELVARKEREFDFKSLKGFSLVFIEEAGKITAINFVQPNGIFKAIRKN